jgi:hypothetical protein
MTTHTPSRWIVFLIALMVLVAAACASVEAAPDDGPVAGDPALEEPGEEPDIEVQDRVQVIPDCPRRIPGSFC